MQKHSHHKHKDFQLLQSKNSLIPDIQMSVIYYVKKVPDYQSILLMQHLLLQNWD